MRMGSVALVMEHRFFVDGTGIFDSEAYRLQLERYAKAFDEVSLVARRRMDSRHEDRLLNRQGRVSFVELPPWSSSASLIAQAPRLRRVLVDAARQAEIMIFRLPSILPVLLWPFRDPYAVEIVGDPEEVISSGIVSLSATQLLGPLWIASQTRVVQDAHVASYVSQTLRDKFPAGRATPTYVASNVELTDEWFESEILSRRTTNRMLAVGTMEQPYKGFHVLLEAIAMVGRSSRCATLTIVGEGRLRHALEHQADHLGLRDRVRFVGRVDFEDMPAVFQEADVFVLPSLTEGMPRVLLEAMASGCLCVATRVGGVPEVLPENVLAEPGDASSLAARIRSVMDLEVQDKLRLRHENRERARLYGKTELDARRMAFLRQVRRLTR